MPNQYFDNTPIEYKKINEDDFDSKLYNVEDKHIIKPNKKGFISDSLLPILSSDFENINTTVINAGVGQGKTTAILEVVAKYANDDDYIIIIAVPFKALIEQYYKDCLKNGISKNKIFSILELDDFFKKSDKEKEKQNWGYTDDEEWMKNHQRKFNIRNYGIHILTVNALLGNSGESLFQSKKRTKYLLYIRNYQ